MSLRVLFILALSVILGAGCTSRGSETSVQDPSLPSTDEAVEPSTTQAETFFPLARANERITKKPFGIRVSPQDSPISPEKFFGYHTGTDFEAFPEEENVDVPVMAICTGPLLRAATASGYGGYAAQSCDIRGEAVTVVYGHLRRSSIQQKVGDLIEGGTAFAVLGTGFSPETDGERKHLHLGIVRGEGINIRGYVSSASLLTRWMDVEDVIEHKN